MKATASFSFDRYISGESSSLLRDLRRAYNDLGFGRGNVVKDGLSLKDDELNEIAERTTLRYLNNDDNIRKGSYTSLSQNGSSSYQSNVTLLGTSSPGINP